MREVIRSEWLAIREYNYPISDTLMNANIVLTNCNKGCQKLQPLK